MENAGLPMINKRRMNRYGIVLLAANMQCILVAKGYQPACLMPYRLEIILLLML